MKVIVFIHQVFRLSDLREAALASSWRKVSEPALLPEENLCLQYLFSCFVALDGADGLGIYMLMVDCLKKVLPSRRGQKPPAGGVTRLPPQASKRGGRESPRLRQKVARQPALKSTPNYR